MPWPDSGSGNPWDRSFGMDFLFEVARGRIPGAKIIRALGEREAMGTTAAGEDIWRGNDLASAPTSHTSIPIPAAAGEQMSVVSENAADANPSGTGARQIRIEYLDASGAEQTTDVNMNGTTDVDLAPSDVRFVNDMYSLSVGSGGVAAGNIRLHQKADNGLVYNMIAAGGNRSLVPNRMVPAGKRTVITGWNCSEAQGRRVTVRLRSTDMNGTLLSGIFCFRDNAYLNQTTSPDMYVWHDCPALSIVKISGWPDAIGAEVGCSWWGVQMDA